jgi:uncharacterized protein YgfB (UPF0149 family)
MDFSKYSDYKMKNMIKVDKTTTKPEITLSLYNGNTGELEVAEVFEMDIKYLQETLANLQVEKTKLENQINQINELIKDLSDVQQVKY